MRNRARGQTLVKHRIIQVGKHLHNHQHDLQGPIVKYILYCHVHTISSVSPGMKTRPIPWAPLSTKNYPA